MGMVHHIGGGIECRRRLAAMVDVVEENESVARLVLGAIVQLVIRAIRSILISLASLVVCVSKFSNWQFRPKFLPPPFAERRLPLRI